MAHWVRMLPNASLLTVRPVMNFCFAVSKASVESARSIPIYDICSVNVSANNWTCARNSIMVDA